MHKAFRGLLLSSLAMFVALAPLRGQEKQPPEQKKESPQEQQPAGEFPKPFEEASSNLRELEKTGFLSLAGVEERAIDQEGRRGFVWTIRPKRMVTARHVQTILRGFRDVRFYVRQASTLQEVHSSMLYYSNRIDTGASNGVVFLKDDQFEVWVPINDSVLRQLAHQKVDLVVFRRLKR